MAILFPACGVYACTVIKGLKSPLVKTETLRTDKTGELTDAAYPSCLFDCSFVFLRTTGGRGVLCGDISALIDSVKLNEHADEVSCQVLPP